MLLRYHTTMLLQLALPDTAVRLFGGMGEITLNVTLLPRNSGGSTGAVELTTSWKNKTATRLAESSWMSFVPSVPYPQKGWRLDVLGSPVDPLSVVINVSHSTAVFLPTCFVPYAVLLCARMLVQACAVGCCFYYKYH